MRKGSIQAKISEPGLKGWKEPNMRIRNVFLCFCLACLLSACAPVMPARKCSALSMLLTQADYPTGTILNDSDTSPVADMPRDSAGFSANYRGSSMYYEVARYKSIDSAKSYFLDSSKMFSKKTDFQGPWEIPAELTYSSRIAQQYHVACGKMGQEYQCRMIGQYEEYGVFFFAYITDNGVTFDILNDLLQKIDARMEMCLKE
jgi:hypothetical protein